jgi:hypothetical protein
LKPAEVQALGEKCISSWAFWVPVINHGAAETGRIAQRKERAGRKDRSRRCGGAWRGGGQRRRGLAQSRGGNPWAAREPEARGRRGPAVVWPRVGYSANTLIGVEKGSSDRPKSRRRKRQSYPEVDFRLVGYSIGSQGLLGGSREAPM